MGEPSPRGAVEQADAAVAYAQTLLDAYGAVDNVDGVVKAGDVTLNDHTELVDAVKDKYGFGCTIFQGNIRISTTAVAAGGTERALGTSTNETITQQVFRSGMHFRGITRTIGKDWVIAYVPLRDHSGRIIGMIAAFRELTEYLDDLELLDGVPEGVLLHTPDGRLCDVNRATCDMLGMSKRQLLQKSIQEFTVGTSHVDGKRTWSANSEPIMLENRWHRADGHEFPVELSVGPATSAKVPTLVTIARDFTERFVVREQLRALNVELAELNHSLEEKVAKRTRELVVARDAALQAHEQTVAILAESPIGVTITDLENGTLSFTNKRVTELFGFTEQELIGTASRDYYAKFG
jgi:PAS domain S-box-containing protein